MKKMKRMLALLLAAVMVLSLASVSAWAAPEASVEETVLMDNDDITVTLTDYDPDDTIWGPTFEVLIENESDRDMGFRLDDASVNGVMCDASAYAEVSAGRKSYDKFSWNLGALKASGINYIEHVEGTLVVDDNNSYDRLYTEPVSWDVNVGETDVPATEPVTFDHGFEELALISGDLVFNVVDYDPTGSYEGTPLMMVYMENHTDRTVNFTIGDMYINGVEDECYWDVVVTPGAVAYGGCMWTRDELDESQIDALELVEFAAAAEDPETGETLVNAGASIDLTGGGETELYPAEYTAGETAQTEEPEVPEETEAPAQTEMTVLGSGGGALMAMTGFDNPGGHNATMDLHLENDTDSAVTFSMDDVTVNGVAYDPLWACEVEAGATEDTDANWSTGFMVFAGTQDPQIAQMLIDIYGIERFETITMTVRAYVSGTEEELFCETVTLNVG